MHPILYFYRDAILDFLYKSLDLENLAIEFHLEVAVSPESKIVNIIPNLIEVSGKTESILYTTLGPRFNLRVQIRGTT